MEAKPQAWLVPRRVVAIVCREKATKQYPANHRRKNKPKLRVNSSIDSHVILHGRPWSVKFLAQRKLQGTHLMRCRRGKGAELAPSTIVVNAAAVANGKIWPRRDRAEMQSRRIYPQSRQTPPQRIGSAIAPVGVNLCGKRPNNTSDFDTIGHAPALAFR
jgi:hypothetical protein